MAILEKLYIFLLKIDLIETEKQRWLAICLLFFQTAFHRTFTLEALFQLDVPNFVFRNLHPFYKSIYNQNFSL